MRKKILAIVAILLANSALAWGQSVDAPAASVPLAADGAHAAEVESKGESILESGHFGKKRLIAEDAEAAEEHESHRKPRIWARSEFLLWFIKPANLPPLVTTGPFTEARPGALDLASTEILFGRGGMDYQDRTGGRFTFGAWLDDDQVWGINAGYFFIRGRSIGNVYSSLGGPIPSQTYFQVLAQPYFNANAGNQDSSLVTFPGIAEGSIVIDAPSFLQGAEINLSAAIASGEHFHWEASIGLRYLNLNEGLNINAVTIVDVAPPFKGFGIPFDGNTITVNDAFETRNHFYGGQVGARAEWTRGRWALDLTGKAALGVSHQIVTIRGSTNIDTQPATAQNAGLFALSSNSGRFTSNRFAVAPEVGATLKFQLTERLQLFGGYSFLYWSSVARPGDQIDQGLNVNLIPTSNTYGAAGGPNRPAFNFHSTDFFAHGANFGLEFRY